MFWNWKRGVPYVVIAGLAFASTFVLVYMFVWADFLPSLEAGLFIGFMLGVLAAVVSLSMAMDRPGAVRLGSLFIFGTFGVMILFTQSMPTLAILLAVTMVILEIPFVFEMLAPARWRLDPAA